MRPRRTPKGERRMVHLRGWHVNVKDCTADVVEFDDELSEMYALCDCDCIDIASRFIGNSAYSIICDDEGLLKDPKSIRVSGIDTDGNAMLVGNLVFVARDEENPGELRSLSDEEIATLRRNTGTYRVRDMNGSYNTVAVAGLAYWPAMSVCGE